MKKCVAIVMTLVSFPFNLFAVVLPSAAENGQGQVIATRFFTGDKTMCNLEAGF